MPESFGARLRQQREERNIALATVAKQTRIKEALLEALERDDLSQWPGSFYRRAFIRAYARTLDLDAEATLQEFLTAHPEPPAVDVMTAMAATFDRGESTSRIPAGLRDVVGAALGSLSRLRRPSSEDSATPALLGCVAPSPTPPPTPPVDLASLAQVCSAFARVEHTATAASLLQEAAGLLGATGLIVWLWDASSAELTPALVHGYSARVVSQLPRVKRDADNATAAAFRTAEPRVIADCPEAQAAIVVPLLTAGGCVGVFAIELQRGRDHHQATAVATILAAQVGHWAGWVRRAEELPRARLAVAGLSHSM